MTWREHLPAGVEMAVYADDTTLHTAITVAENVNHVERTLQHAVDAVFDWGNKWCITFEPTKSQCMTITHKRVPSSLTCHLCRISSTRGG